MDTTTKTPKACIGDMFPSVFPGMPMFPTHTTADGPPRSTPVTIPTIA